jgi:transcriptional regulator with XRE-family HTH domain
MQQEVAERLGVHVESVKNWERGAGSPTIKQIPKIIEFLGYAPAPLPGTILEQIRAARRRLASPRNV